MYHPRSESRDHEVNANLHGASNEAEADLTFSAQKSLSKDKELVSTPTHFSLCVFLLTSLPTTALSQVSFDDLIWVYWFNFQI